MLLLISLLLFFSANLTQVDLETEVIYQNAWMTFNNINITNFQSVQVRSFRLLENNNVL